MAVGGDHLLSCSRKMTQVHCIRRQQLFGCYCNLSFRRCSSRKTPLHSPATRRTTSTLFHASLILTPLAAPARFALPWSSSSESDKQVAVMDGDPATAAGASSSLSAVLGAFLVLAAAAGAGAAWMLRRTPKAAPHHDDPAAAAPSAATAGVVADEAHADPQDHHATPRKPEIDAEPVVGSSAGGAASPEAAVSPNDGSARKANHRRVPTTVRNRTFSVFVFGHAVLASVSCRRLDNLAATASSSLSLTSRLSSCESHRLARMVLHCSGKAIATNATFWTWTMPHTDWWSVTASTSGRRRVQARQEAAAMVQRRRRRYPRATARRTQTVAAQAPWQHRQLPAVAALSWAT